MPKSNLESALEFYNKTMDSTLEERSAVGRDHINWLVNASVEAILEIGLLKNLLRRHVEKPDTMKMAEWQQLSQATYIALGDE